jgi:hypothetical protein
VSFNLLKLCAFFSSQLSVKAKARRGEEEKINFVSLPRKKREKRGKREERNWKKGKLTEGNCLFAVQWRGRERKRSEPSCVI